MFYPLINHLPVYQWFGCLNIMQMNRLPPVLRYLKKYFAYNYRFVYGSSTPLKCDKSIIIGRIFGCTFTAGRITYLNRM